MFRPLLCVLAAFVLVGLVSPAAFGQIAAARAGSRGMLDEETTVASDFPPLDRKVAESYITIEGKAEVRVPATDTRMVLAVTSEAQTAQECRRAVNMQIDRLREAWSKIGIGPDKMVVDFIAVLPRYQWTPEKHGYADVEVEKRVGYRMQTNVHLAAKSEAEADAAIAAALEQGLTDIIAFDYWNKDLDETKVKARDQALKAARGKADSLLGALFANRPPVLNVQEQTTVRYPESLYHSFTNVADDTPESRHRDIPFIHAYRPRNTYYRGVYGDSDVKPRELPMKPEISVISTVRLYFKSPAADAKKEPAQSAK